MFLTRALGRFILSFSMLTLQGFESVCGKKTLAGTPRGSAEKLAEGFRAVAGKRYQTIPKGFFPLLL
jgi:hypothetical protein